MLYGQTQRCEGSCNLYVLYLRSFFMQKSYVKDNENIVLQILAKLCCYNYERAGGTYNIVVNQISDVKQP